METTRFFPLGDFALDCGETVPSAVLAYETYGTLRPDRSNAVLLFHALTGSQHAHGYNPSIPEIAPLWQEENHQGWWNAMIGSGRPLDTDRYFIICANLLGSCYGSSGPYSTHPDGTPWGSRFPLITAGDQARAQAALLGHFGIERLHLVGPSVGGLVGLAFTALYPSRVHSFITIGSGYKPSMDHQLSVFEQILAIELDPRYLAGRYPLDNPPKQGLAFARIIGHKAFVYQEGLAERARESTGDRKNMLTWYTPTRNTQSYMLHQGTKFANRFDANSYIRIADMWINYDLRTITGTATLEQALEPCRAAGVPFLVFSIDTDACFRPEEQREYVDQLRRIGIPAEYHLIRSEKGHDSFLLEPELYAEPIARFLQRGNA